jgi:diguanylate cyclase (GGDEF)-like protein
MPVMPPTALEHIRNHRRTLAARWAERLMQGRGAEIWRDPHRLDRATAQGMDAIVEAAVAARADGFVDFAARFSHESFAHQVPLDAVTHAFLEVKPLVLAMLEEGPNAPGIDPDAVQYLNHVVSAGLVEAIRQHERQRERRTLALQEQIEELRDQLRRQDVVDPYTELYNANYFSVAVRQEVLRSRRFTRTFAIALIALDQYEELREALGEDGTRRAMPELARILTATTRQVDVRAYLGAGRFGIILPETTLDGAHTLAERARHAVEAEVFPDRGHPTLRTHTISSGLAAYPRDGDDDQTLLARAEEALARARVGRNTTVTAAATQEF